MTKLITKVTFVTKRTDVIQQEYFIDTMNYNEAEKTARTHLFFDGYTVKDFNDIVMVQVNLFKR